MAGLTVGTAYPFTVTASNGVGSNTSAATTAVTPGSETTYAYAQAGNMTSTQSDGLTTANTYNADEELTKATTGSAAISYNYDADGDQTSASGQTYAYSGAGELSQATTPAGTFGYSYDADGNLSATRLNGSVLQRLRHPQHFRRGGGCAFFVHRIRGLVQPSRRQRSRRHACSRFRPRAGPGGHLWHRRSARIRHDQYRGRLVDSGYFRDGQLFVAHTVISPSIVAWQAAGMVTTTAHRSAGPSYVVPGVLVLMAGLLVMVVGILLWRDTWGILTKFYGRVIRSWRGIPFSGEIWIRQSPFSEFRTRALAIVLGGVMLAAVGIFLIARPS